jgi:hypothetical protein
MAKTHPEIDQRLRDFIAAQHMFFVATAPSGDGGHVNLSPKGLDTFRVVDPHTVAYLDFTGSGVETISHVRQNGRITVMFCAFAGPPLIVRLYGKGEAIEPAHGDFPALAALFPSYPGVRSVIRVALDRITDSCGYGVPLYGYQGERRQLTDWAERKGRDGVAEYQRANNTRSIDGLPGLDA